MWMKPCFHPLLSRHPPGALVGGSLFGDFWANLSWFAMGMHAPVPQFLLDANVAGGLVRFFFFSRESGGFSIIFCGISSALSFTNTLFGQFSPLLTAGSCWDRGFATRFNFSPIKFCSHEETAHSRGTFYSASNSSRSTNSDYTPSTSIREEIEEKTIIRENIQLQ